MIGGDSFNIVNSTFWCKIYERFEYLNTIFVIVWMENIRFGLTNHFLMEI